MKTLVAVTLACTLAAPLHAQRVPTTRDELPALSLPDPRLDDTTAYEGYRTRFYHDSKGNTLQIYLRRNEARVVNLWADAANASSGKPRPPSRFDRFAKRCPHRPHHSRRDEFAAAHATHARGDFRSRVSRLCRLGVPQGPARRATVTRSRALELSREAHGWSP